LAACALARGSCPQDFLFLWFPCCSQNWFFGNCLWLPRLLLECLLVQWVLQLIAAAVIMQHLPSLLLPLQTPCCCCINESAAMACASSAAMATASFMFQD